MQENSKSLKHPEEIPSLATMPREIKTSILEHLVTNNPQETVKNICNFARVNREFNAIINHPQNIKLQIEYILYTF